jgi:hypothetical protein
MPSVARMAMIVATTEPSEEADVTHIDHARRLLTQVYYRQNCKFTS